MPRRARLDIAGALHHIMVRGGNRSPIFLDDEDRARFLKRLGEKVTEGKCDVYAWVLMANHVHLLFKTGEQGISTVMRRVLTWYAQYFNRRHHRTGHLFENRYKSILCEEKTYLLSLVRYIHLNPVRGKITATLDDLDRYPWSGHSALMGRAKHPWMSTDFILSQFGSKKSAARRAYHTFMAEGMGLGKQPELTGGGLIRSKGGWSQVLAARGRYEKEESDERILGDGDFVTRVLKEAEEKTRRQLRIRKSGGNIEKIIEEECRRGGVAIKEIKAGSRRRKVSAVRARIAKYGIEELGLSLAEVARKLGVNTSSVARAVTRGESMP